MNILNDFNTNLRIRENELRLIKIQYEKRIKFLKRIIKDLEFVCNKKVIEAEFKWKDIQACQLHYKETVEKTIFELRQEKESKSQMHEDVGRKYIDLLNKCSLQEDTLLTLNNKCVLLDGKLTASNEKLKKASNEIKKLKEANKDV